MIGRIRSAYERNPNEGAESVNVRDTLGIQPNYPNEEDSTIIFRQVEADLIEEFIEVEKDGKKKTEIRAPQNLPNSGANVYVANPDEIVLALGLQKDKDLGLHIGETTSGASTQIILKREAIQRHFFIGGTTGSGKSYAMGVLAEELLSHNLPVVFIDTQDEYSTFVQKNNGTIVNPGKNFHIRISSLTESELLDLLPEAMKRSALQMDIVAKAFGELQAKLTSGSIAKFSMNDLITKVEEVAPELTAKR